MTWSWCRWVGVSTSTASIGVVGQQAAQVGVEGLGPPFLGRLAAHLLVGVADGDDVAAGVLQVAPDVHGRDVAGAQHAQPDLVHQTLPCADDAAYASAPNAPPSRAAAI